MSTVKIEPRGNNVWAIMLDFSVSNYDQIRDLPEVREWVSQHVKGTPYFEALSPKYWYLVDKLSGNDDETDYLKDVFINRLVGKELTPDAKQALEVRGYLDSTSVLSPNDKIQFERHIEDGDTFDLVSSDGKDKIRVFITNVRIVCVSPNEVYEAKYTLTRS